MAVGTGNISLQDVVDEVQPDFNTLRRCFDDANLFGFDPNYIGARDRLSNFKGYDGTLTGSTSIDPTSVLIGSTGGSFNITVTSNDNWSVTTNVSDWVSFSPTSGSLNGTVTVTVAPNNIGGATERSGRVTVAGENSTGGFCLVTQEGVQ